MDVDNGMTSVTELVAILDTTLSTLSGTALVTVGKTELAAEEAVALGSVI